MICVGEEILFPFTVCLYSLYCLQHPLTDHSGSLSMWFSTRPGEGLYSLTVWYSDLILVCLNDAFVAWLHPFRHSLIHPYKGVFFKVSLNCRQSNC